MKNHIVDFKRREIQHFLLMFFGEEVKEDSYFLDHILLRGCKGYVNMDDEELKHELANVLYDIGDYQQFIRHFPQERWMSQGFYNELCSGEIDEEETIIRGE